MSLSNLIAKLPSVSKRTPRVGLGESGEVNRHQLYILPTRHGLVFSLMTIIMLLAAINYNNNMTFALCFGLISVAIISMFHTYQNMLNLSFSPRANPGCFAGDIAEFKLQLSHDQPQAKVQISVQIANAHDRAEAPNDITTVSLDRNSPKTVAIAMPSVHRGRLSLGRVVISTLYPFGLFRAWAYAEIENDILIYPQPAESAAELPFHQADGDRVDSQEVGSDDFHGLRSYQQGDSPRHLHWKSWAQGKELVTKQFNRMQSPDLWLEWDFINHADPEQRLSVLCRWVLEAEARDQHYGLKIPGTVIEPGAGELHRRRCLEALALFGEVT